MDIKSKKAIVFGGTSGIGLATCLELQARGANVVSVSRNPTKAGTSINGICLAAVDARDSNAVSAFFETQGKIDILISSATGDRVPLARSEMDIDGFKGSFDKLWGYSNVVRYGAPKLSDHGTIVLVSGTPARKMKPGQVALSAVGGAVRRSPAPLPQK